MSGTQTTLSGDTDPWKDADTLRGLYHDDDLTQPQIADRLGTTTSTISYWMKKHEIGTSHSSYTATGSRGGPEICVMCEENRTPGGSNTANYACDDCLSRVRSRDSEAEYDHYGEYLNEL